MKLKYVAAVVLMISLILGIPQATRVTAEAETVLPQYTYTSHIAVGFSISGGVADCSGYIRLNDINRNAALWLILQKYDDGWVAIHAWYSGKNTGAASIDETYTLTSGYKYRLYAIGYAYDSNGNIVETVTKASSPRTY